MGTVYEALELEKNRLVAVKLITSVEIREEVVTRFWREAEAASSIDSPHIVKVWETGTEPTNNMPYMVMERLEGEDISSALKRSKMLPIDVALRLTAQAAMGLARAHEKGIVHRDIKPANLFLAITAPGEYTVKILDFGIAKVKMDTGQETEEGALTRTGSMLGSPHYMSPEQAQGLRTVDERTDIWSLGVVMYKMITGKTPHSGVDALGQVILSICSKPARPITELAPWVSPALSSVIHRCLQIDAARRFQSMQELYMALSPLLGRSRIVHIASIRPISDDEKAASVVIPPTPSTPMVPPAPAAPASVQQAVTSPNLPPPKMPPESRKTVMSQHRIETAAEKDSKRMRQLVIAGGIGLGLCASAGAAWAVNHKPADAEVVAKPPRPEATPPATVVDASETQVEAADTVSASIHIVPADAEVELDGKPAQLSEGKLLLRGQPLSHHRVLVKAFGKVIDEDVFLTANGAVPAMLTVKK